MTPTRPNSAVLSERFPWARAVLVQKGRKLFATVAVRKSRKGFSSISPLRPYRPFCDLSGGSK